MGSALCLGWVASQNFHDEPVHAMEKFETSVAAWGMGLLLSIPSAIACAMIASHQARPGTAG